eukprot:6687578-Prymnesium_polylepis.1
MLPESSTVTVAAMEDLGMGGFKDCFQREGPCLPQDARVKQTGELLRRSTQTCTRSTVAAL